MMNEAGYHLSKNYPRALAAYGAWAAFGIALILLATEQYFFGAILALFGAGMIVLAIRGGRSSERPYSRTDLTLQWFMLVIPTVFAIVFFLLALAFLRPYIWYFAIYLAVLLFLAILVGRELTRREPTDPAQ